MGPAPGSELIQSGDQGVAGARAIGGDHRLARHPGGSGPHHRWKTHAHQQAARRADATNVRTGKTSPEPVALVLIHHDTDLYDLRVKTSRGTSVIHTSHLEPVLGAVPSGTSPRT
ncbi:MAG: hypothetical protein ACRDNZ_05190, partial [Streptosporangiaceae bacterium]